MAYNGVSQETEAEAMGPGAHEAEPDDALEPARSHRGWWQVLVMSAVTLRALVWALPGLIVDRQLNRPLPESVQGRVPGWLQTGTGRLGAGVAAVAVVALWGIGLMFLAGLL